MVRSNMFLSDKFISSLIMASFHLTLCFAFNSAARREGIEGRQDHVHIDYADTERY